MTDAHIKLTLRDDEPASVELGGETVGELELNDETRTLELLIQYEDGAKTRLNVALGR